MPANKPMTVVSKAVIIAVVGLWTLLGGLMEIFASFELRRLPETLEAVRRSAGTPSDAADGGPTTLGPRVGTQAATT